MLKHQVAQLKNGDIFELLENLYLYKVHFHQINNSELPSTSPAEMVGKQTTLNNFLKRKEKEETDADEDKTSSSPARKKNKTGDSWEEFDHGKLLIFTSDGIEAKPKVSYVPKLYIIII